MNPDIIKRIILSELYPAISLSRQQDIDLNSPLKKKEFWTDSTGIKRFHKIERILGLPPIPFRLDCNKDFFDITLKEILNYVNFQNPKTTTPKQIADNLTLINAVMKRLSTVATNNRFSDIFNSHCVNKEYDKHMYYLIALKAIR